ncbi:MAG: hypothetical protein II951_05010 [Bacteroidales bacterium]|nr:hypothetical protein [Bacteroidales bacterium]
METRNTFERLHGVVGQLLVTMLCLLGFSGGAKAGNLPWWDGQQTITYTPDFSTGNGWYAHFGWITYNMKGDESGYYSDVWIDINQDGSSTYNEGLWNLCSTLPYGSYINYRNHYTHGEPPGWTKGNTSNSGYGYTTRYYRGTSPTTAEDPGYQTNGITFNTYNYRVPEGSTNDRLVDTEIYINDFYDGMPWCFKINGQWWRDGYGELGWTARYVKFNAPVNVTWPQVVGVLTGNGEVTIGGLNSDNTTNIESKEFSNNNPWRYYFEVFASKRQNGQWSGNDRYELEAGTNVSIENLYRGVSSEGATKAKFKIKSRNFSNWSTTTLYPCVTRWTLFGGRQLRIHKYYAPIYVYGFCRAKNVATSYDGWTRKVSLSWDYEDYCADTRHDGKWVVFRQDLSTNTISKMTGTSLALGTRTYTDNSIEVEDYGKTFRYYVAFEPNGWSLAKPGDAKDLYKTIDVKVTRPGNMLKTLKAEDGVTAINVSWTFDSFKDASNSKKYEIKLYRKKNSEDKWGSTPIYTQYVTSPSQNSGDYTDNTGLESRVEYNYKIEVEAVGTKYVWGGATCSLSTGTSITEVTASLGMYEKSVTINWNVNRVGEQTTYYNVSRRLLGSNGAWQTLYTTSGTAEAFSYEDSRAQPGSFYEYQVDGYEYVGTQKYPVNGKSTEGFATTSGVISGRISYGTGTAVDGVKVSLVNSDDDNPQSLFRSTKFDFGGAAIQYKATAEDAQILVGGDFTMQMYIKPDGSSMNDASKEYVLYDVTSSFAVRLKYENGGYKVGVGLGTYYYTDAVMLKADEWRHLSIVNKGGKYTVYVTTPEEEISRSISTGTFSIGSIASEKEFTLGNYSGFAAPANFRGLIDDFRWFTKALTAEDIQRNYNHRLSGDEDGLAIYWPMDEGIPNQSKVFDYSKTGGLSNGRHGKMEVNTNTVGVTSSAETRGNVPDETKFSLCAVTDVNGNYTISGVPFAGSGVAYSVIPTKGVHEFSPAKQNRFVSMSSLVANGVDFTDVSSFKVTGAVYYEGTTYPVEGVQFSVDGTLCTKDNNLVETDENGEFEISVPIGWHYITASKSGHTFANAGRYPAETAAGAGNTREFTQAMTGLTFYDNTLVPVVGRVVGGKIEGEKPLGFGASQNNIGQAELVLKASDTYRLNVVRQDDGASSQYVNATTVRTFDIPAGASVANDASATVGTTNDEEGKIVVKTDMKTGEWAAMLPPLKYTVTSIKLVNAKTVDLTKGIQQIIDATNPEVTSTDSILVEDNGEQKYDKFEYVASLKTTYRTTAELTVSQNGAEAEGAFGESTFSYKDNDGKLVKKSLYAKKQEDGQAMVYSVPSGETAGYTYGYPLFIQDRDYAFDMYLREVYENVDVTPHKKDYVPLQNVVITIGNEMGAGNAVVLRPAENDTEYEAGDIYELSENEVLTDSTGRAKYVWTAGMPNIQSPYTRTMTITYNLDGTQCKWNGGNSLHAIVLGDLPTGSNFVTSGPDKVMMILRDPPGTNSQAYIQEGTTMKKTSETKSGFTTENEVTTETHFGVNLDHMVGLLTPTGQFTGVSQRVESEKTLEVGANYNLEKTSSTEVSEEITTTKKVSTSDGSDFVGAVGDVFIGTATNYVFGAVRQVGLYYDESKKDIVMDQRDAISMGTRFGTEFNYTANYIENVLIPNFETIRNSILERVDSYDAIKANNTDKPKYYTTLSKDDERYGSNNGDTDVWGDEAAKPGATEGPSYKMVLPADFETNKAKYKNMAFTDTISWYNMQINNWIDQLAANEKAKVKAIESREKYLVKNYSFDAGAAIESSTSTTVDTTYNTEIEHKVVMVVGWSSDIDIAGTGVDYSVKTTTGGSTGGSEGVERSYSTEKGFTLAEDGDDDALSVDVLTAPDEFGLIFYTRGGQTCCPYEDAVKTKYYRPGFEIQAKTMQIEIPKISADVTTLTGVPSGKTANFTVNIQNLSETGEDCWFGIFVADGSNPNGADVRMDGYNISNGRNILVPAGQPLTKTITIKQTDESVYDYEGIEVNLYSLCQPDGTGVFPEISSSVFLSAYFQQTSTDVRLRAQESSLNMGTGATMHLTIDDYDVNAGGLKGIRLEAQQVGSPSWTMVKNWVVSATEAASDVNKELLSSSGTFSYVLDMENKQTFPDGTWNIRAVSYSDFGGNEVTTTSEVITIDKDMSRPQLIAMPSPANGVLTADGEISLTFNEDIRSGAIAKADNFYVRGVLNDAEVQHDVALNLTGGDGAKTTSNINLGSRSFSVNTWIRYTEPGTIFMQGQGDNAISISIDANDKLVVSHGEQTVVSENALQKGKWQFVSVGFSAEDSVVYADYAYDAYEVKLIKGKRLALHTGKGPVTVGKGLVGQIHEVTLWNTFRSWVEAQGGMYTMKTRYSDGLMGYWKMDEGRGTMAEDEARSHNMQVAGENAWYIDGENYALELSGAQVASINTGAVVTDKEESYTIEFWFRAEQQQAGAANLVGFDKADKLDIGLDSKGAIELRSMGTSYTCSNKDYRDNQWHHVALNVLKSSNGSATVYVDGVAVKQIAVAAIPSIQTAKMLLGGHRNGQTSAYDEKLKGAIDEVRIWTGSRTGEIITDNMYNRVDTCSRGLVAYYPFERIQLDEGNQPVTVSTAADRSATGAGKAAIQSGTGAVKMTKGNTAALKPAPTLQNVAFDYVSSERKILINLTTEAQRIEGTTIDLTVQNIRDTHNNSCEDVNWSVYVRRNQLLWGESEVEVIKEGEKAAEFQMTVNNTSGLSESWSVSGLPSWLSVSADKGTIAAQSTMTLTFKVDKWLPYGSYEAVVKLRGSLGVEEPLVVSVMSKCETPEWEVVPAEETMSVVGQLKIDGKIANDEGDVIAAFYGQECVGVTNLDYFSRYDASYALINIYGQQNMDSKALTYKVFDAGTCKVYTSVKATDNKVFSYKNDGSVGDFDTPVVFMTENYIEQDLSATTPGWKWISLYVIPEDASVPSIFADVDGEVSVVKSRTESKVYNGTAWIGDLSEMGQSGMYKLLAESTYKETVSGLAVDPTTVDITLNPGWSWIGYPAQESNSLNVALADADPQNGDIIKGQTSFSVFNSGEWIGKLAGLTPGQGYSYYSNAGEAKTFRYPVPVQEGRNKTVRRSELELGSESNMTMIAVVKEGGRTVEGAEVKVYAGGELVGQSEVAVVGEEHFVTIGSSDANILNFVVKTANGETRLAQTEQFASDRMLGTVENPYVLQLSAEDVTGTGDGEIEKVELYDILGRLVAVKAKAELSNMPSGVYMKVVYFTDGTVRTEKVTK